MGSAVKTGAIARAVWGAGGLVATITGSAGVGNVLTLVPGSGYTITSYQWTRNGSNIAGATSSTYTQQAADQGTVISCVVAVTASNVPGVSVPAEPLPVNTVLPVITGTPQQGQTLTASTGTWTNSTGSYTYQWHRDGSPIGGATASTYLLGASDVGTAISVAVTASNVTGGTTAAFSAATALILPAGATATVSASLTGAEEITFTLGAASAAYLGVRFGIAPNYDLGSLMLPVSGTSGTIVAYATDGIVAGNRIAYQAYMSANPLDNPADRVYGATGTIDVPGVPMAPQAITVGTPGATSLPLTATAPIYNGGSAITDYVWQYRQAGSPTWLTFADGTSAGLTATITGLTQLTPYELQVAAVNANGQGPWSDTYTATTAAGAAGSWTFGAAPTMGFAAGPQGSLSTGAVAVSVGQVVFVAVSWENNDGTTRTVTDSAGNTYTPLTLRADSPRQWTQLFYTVATNASASNVVTVNFGVSTVGYISIGAAAFTPPTGTLALDSQGGGPIATTQNTSTTIDPVFSGAGIVLYAAKNYATGSNAAGSGWSLIGTTNFFTFEYQIVANGNPITGATNRASGTTFYVDAWAAFNTV